MSQSRSTFYILTPRYLTTSSKGRQKMRFNEKEMRCVGKMAVNTEKEGKLMYRKSDSSKSKGYKYRWFRLRGNLLFYFKTSEGGILLESEPQGVMVLERCKVQHEQFSDRPHVFSIAFQDDSGDKKHYFSSASQAQSEEWVTLLRKASYEQLRATLVILQAQILKHTGHEPRQAFQHNLMSAMLQAGRGHGEPPPTIRSREGSRDRAESKERRKGLSAEAAEAAGRFAPLDTEVSDVPYLDMPISPRRTHGRNNWQDF